MFDRTIEAFNTSDRYRVPVLILADEVIGHMVERVVIPAEEKIERWERKRPNLPPDKSNGGFRPFQIEDDDLVPPMVHAGEGYKIHFTGLTHDERGYPDMTAQTHHDLVSRLSAKIRHNAERIIRTEDYYLDDAQIVIVSFGCTARSARRAVSLARATGIKVGLIRLISIWPFPEAYIHETCSSAEHIIVAEMNLGQISLEVERITKKAVEGVFHAGGAMITPQSIMNKIQELAS